MQTPANAVEIADSGPAQRLRVVAGAFSGVLWQLLKSWLKAS